MKRLLLVLMIVVFHTPIVLAQNPFGNRSPIFYLNKDSTRYLKFHTVLQVWVRSTQNNPGTTVFDELESVTKDLAIRRFRLGLNGYITEKLYFYSQIGLNNLNYLSDRSVSVDLLDAQVEYQFHRAFQFGLGKTAWNGVSRYAAPSTSKALAYDIPIVSIPLVNVTDDLLRKLAMYAKGKVGRFDYRVVLAKPFSVQSTSQNITPQEGIAAFADLPNVRTVSSYIKYEFWDRESNLTAFSSGTYLGTKKVMSVGAGYERQGNATWSLQNGDTVLHDLQLFGLDYFLELPVGKKMAMNFYAVYHYYDFGPNYIRNIGVNNPATGVDPDLASFNGRGNAFPQIGTGHTLFWQGAWLFPKITKVPWLGRFQPYMNMQYSQFERLDDPMIYVDLGFNWILAGHGAKLSFNIQNRPIFFERGEQIVVEDRKNMFVLQVQIRID